MPALSPPAPVRRARDVVQRREDDARAVVQQATGAMRDARERARDARRQLAREILDARSAFFPTLTEFTAAVAARLEISPLTVRNALRETFSADVLGECVSVLAEARTSAGASAGTGR